jgi:hypothetical protein
LKREGDSELLDTARVGGENICAITDKRRSCGFHCWSPCSDGNSKTLSCIEYTLAQGVTAPVEYLVLFVAIQPEMTTKEDGEAPYGHDKARFRRQILIPGHAMVVGVTLCQ